MSLISRLLPRLWTIVPLGVLVFLAAAGSVRIKRAAFVSAVTLETAQLRPSDASPTGYAGGVRQLIVPEHLNESYDWIAQTQQMLASDAWRVRHIDYENAPLGREVSLPSPYRWWLASVARILRTGSDLPISASVEHAALYADPALYLLLAAVTLLFVAWQFGPTSTVAVSLGFAALFPFSTSALPGAPDANGLALAGMLGGLLLLFAGLNKGNAAAAPRFVFVSGLFFGFGLWIDPVGQRLVLLGVGLGGLLAAWIGSKNNATPSPRLWRAWSMGGALMCFIAYLIEYFPDGLAGWQLRTIHPLYGVAWLGSGELLARLTARFGTPRAAWTIRDTLGSIAGLVAFAALPVAAWFTDQREFFPTDLLSLRLTKLSDGVMAPSLAAWIARDRLTMTFWSTILPVLGVGVAAWLAARRATAPAQRVALAVGIGAALVALAMGFLQLRWWHTFDAIVLAIIAVASLAFTAPASRWLWSGGLVLLLLPGAILALPKKSAVQSTEFTLLEVTGMVERDLSYWLTRRIPSLQTAVVLAPPGLSGALHYYGSLPGLASYSWENKAGLAGATRILSATSIEESRELIQQRGITHIILPTWDTFFEDFIRTSGAQAENSFVAGLHRWALPNWLRPVPYQVPRIAGFEEQSAVIFEVVDTQDDPTALSRLAEYFIETGQATRAASVAQALQRYPAHLGAQVARAQVAEAQNQSAELTRILDSLLARLSAGADRNLPWDRRISLAVVLARSKQLELARKQIELCLKDANEARLRSLTTGSLYHLLVMGRAFELQIPDQRTRQLAIELLPPELRGRL